MIVEEPHGIRQSKSETCMKQPEQKYAYFYEKVDKRSRSTMTEWLKNHFRYYAFSSWNGDKTYAQNVKIHSLKGLTAEQRDKLYALCDDESAREDLHWILSDFSERWNDMWHITFNGRGNGYMILLRVAWSPTLRRYVKSDPVNDDDTALEIMDIEAMRERVALLQDFDRTVDTYITCALNYQPVEQEDND